MSTSALQSADVGTTADHKAVLFCPTCGHADSIGGEWVTHVVADHDRLECPVCGTTVLDQPRF